MKVGRSGAGMGVARGNRIRSKTWWNNIVIVAYIKVSLKYPTFVDTDCENENENPVQSANRHNRLHNRKRSTQATLSLFLWKQNKTIPYKNIVYYFQVFSKQFKVNDRYLLAGASYNRRQRKFNVKIFSFLLLRSFVLFLLAVCELNGGKGEKSYNSSFGRMPILVKISISFVL